MKILQKDKDKGNGKHRDIEKEKLLALCLSHIITFITIKCNLFIIPLYIGTAEM